MIVFPRHPTLSEKLSAPQILYGLPIEVDETKDLSLVLSAAMPGYRNEFLSVGAMTLSMGNSDIVKGKVKQHANVIFT